MTRVKRNIDRIVYVYISIFLLMFIYYGLTGYREQIPGYMIFLQLFYFIAYTVSIYLFTRYHLNRRSILSYIFIYSLIAGFTVRAISWSYLNEPFLGGVDSQTYDWLANFGVSRGFSYSKYLTYLRHNELNVDDWGMPSIVYWTYRVFGNGRFGQDMLIVVNAIAITAAAYLIDNLLKSFGTEQQTRFFCLAVYGCFPFLSLTAAVGLKENFFCLLIIGTFCQLQRYSKTRRICHLTLAGVFIVGCFFFRVATFAMLIISMLVSLISKESNKKLVLTLIIIGCFIGVMGLSVVLQHLYGLDIDVILGLNDARTAEGATTIGSAGMWIIQGVSLIFGPYANFAKMSEYAIVHSSGVLLKGVIGFSMIVGILYSIKHLQWQYYAIIAYMLMHSIMLVLAGVSLDMRYQITAYPLALPFVAQYVQKNINNDKKNYAEYIGILFFLVWFYNKR